MSESKGSWSDLKSWYMGVLGAVLAALIVTYITSFSNTNGRDAKQPILKTQNTTEDSQVVVTAKNKMNKEVAKLNEPVRNNGAQNENEVNIEGTTNLVEKASENISTNTIENNYLESGKYLYSRYVVKTRSEARNFCLGLDKQIINARELGKAASNYPIANNSTNFVSSKIENGEVLAWIYKPELRRARRVRTEKLEGIVVCEN